MKRKLFLVIVILFLALSETFANVSLIMPNMSGQNGTQVTVPVKVKDFINIESAQGTIQFDHAIVRLISVQNFGLPGMFITDFGMADTVNGKLTFSWYDQTFAAPTLTDSTVIFSITFKIVGTTGQNSPLSFVDVPTQMEVTDSLFNVQTLNLINGSITVVNITGMDSKNLTHTNSLIVNNYPNPFPGLTNIVFNLPLASEVSLLIYDVDGKEVFNIAGYYESGRHVFVWDGKENDGQRLSDGIYYLSLQTDNFSAKKKMILTR